MSEFSPRVQAALDSRATAVNDFFGGWEPADLDLLRRWAVDPASLRPIPGVIVDWLGGRTSIANHAWLTAPESGVVVADLPVPDDQIHAETIEYVALLNAVERARLRGKRFTMFELGASYAPWCVLGAITAERAGCKRITVCAVEASRASFGRIDEHFRLNGLDDNRRIACHAINAAVSARPGTLYFPRVDTAADNGAQVTAHPGRVDYRGVPVEYDEVEAVTLADLLERYGAADLVHLDLQGAEELLLDDRQFLDGLTSSARTLMLATQSRLIEGLALRELAARGWRLHRERPTMFVQNERTPDPNGWTVRDGAQVWFNDSMS